jgi:hypothetical protein
VLAVGGLLPGGAQAAPPQGLVIGGSGACLNREGGWSGFRVNYEFLWHRPTDTPDLPDSITIGGTYSVLIHSASDGATETLFSFPYGFSLDNGAVERRTDRFSPREPHWVVDYVKLVTTWKIDETGATGQEETILNCDTTPPPPDKQPIARQTEPPGPSAAGGTDLPSGTPEVFAVTTTPPIYPGLVVDSQLQCTLTRGGRAGHLIGYSLIMTNDGSDGRLSQGVTAAGVLRLYRRAAGADYALEQERQFAQFMKPNETTDLTDWLSTKEPSNAAAVKLEVEWRTTPGSEVDQNAPIERHSRSTACTSG